MGIPFVRWAHDRHRLMMVGAAVILMSAGIYWSAIRSTRPSDASPATKITIANFVYTGNCPLLAADAKGYFAQEGVDATVNTYSSGKLALDAVFNGKADLGISGDLPVMFSVMNGRPIVVVANMAKAENDVAVVARRSSGINQPSDLKAKRIGVPTGTAGHYYLDALLIHHHLSIDDVQVVDLGTDQMAAAMGKGVIDAASTWEPYVGAIQNQLGSDGVVFPAGEIYKPTMNVCGTAQYVKTHATALPPVIRALAAGASYCSAHPDDARLLVATTYHLDPDTLKASWPDFRFRVSLDQALLTALEDETRWAAKNRLAARSDMPNYLDHLYLDAMQATFPKAITVIH
ncbi:MAG: NrtA/SsuA/CpmA family ABC transporter substrate-binding protein [Burkholderiales bacterium]|nr:NrtA/SsuA/CpmA family ABC transporter substrate-binding protein [Burkholderiales bacterium]